jgi:hypothetical protein
MIFRLIRLEIYDGVTEKVNNHDHYIYSLRIVQNRIVLLILCSALFFGLSSPGLFANGSQEDEQPAVTWKTFKDRNNLFTAQYPSNWTVSGLAEEEIAGPIDVLFLAPIEDEDDVAEVEFIQYAEPSIFSTPQEALESEINSLQNDPTVTKFEIERPVECSSHNLSGLPACSYIYEIASTDGGNLAVMAVDALAPDGTEYEVYYRASFDLFEDLLPTAEQVIGSIQLTGNNSAATDFSLESEGLSLNDTTSTTNTTGSPPNADSSGDEDFSLSRE